MNEKIITITEKTVYGKTCYYPACELSRLVCSVANTKQLTPEIGRHLKAAGYRVVVAPTPTREI